MTRKQIFQLPVGALVYSKKWTVHYVVTSNNPRLRSFVQIGSPWAFLPPTLHTHQQEFIMSDNPTDMMWQKTRRIA